jgi:hypothetical protein
MNWQERVVVWVLKFHDALLNIFTLGIWDRIKGNERIAFFWKDDE